MIPVFLALGLMDQFSFNMARQIISRIIGPLTQHDQFPDWWESGEVEIPFWGNKRMRITFMDVEPEADPTFVSEADQALMYFLRMGPAERSALSSLVYQNCREFLAEVDNADIDDALRQIRHLDEIWPFVYPGEIYVTRRPYKDQDVYVLLACGCEWEQEHGLQLVFRQGRKLTRISDQDGHLTEADAYGKPDEEDELLSQF